MCSEQQDQQRLRLGSKIEVGTKEDIEGFDKVNKDTVMLSPLSNAQRTNILARAVIDIV
jgi:hypothetical protein